MRQPIPTPSTIPSECGRFRWGWYRAADGSLKSDVKIDHECQAVYEAHKWREDAKGYLVTSIWNIAAKRSTNVPLHLLVLRAPAGLCVDHRRRNKKDNRRAMLRVSTFQQNSANRRLSRRNRSSKFQGVTFHRKTGRWQAQLETGGRCIYLGLYHSEVEAAVIRDAKAREMFGPWAVINSINPMIRAKARVTAQARAKRVRRLPVRWQRAKSNTSARREAA